MFYDEEELLEAVDILMEDYGYDEDEAIDLVLESYEDDFEEDEIDDYELEDLAEALDILMEDYGYDEDEAMDLLVEGFIGNFIKRKTNEAIENSKEMARRKAEEAIENKKQEFKKGLDNRKKALTDTVKYGVGSNRNKAKFETASKNLKNYAYKDRKIIGGVAVAGTALLARRALKKRRLRKEVNKILNARERNRR